MAIEEQPLFPEWSEALDQLVIARDVHTKAKSFGAHNLEASEMALFSAIRRFKNISDKIDA